MRVVLQRVSRGRVSIDGSVAGEIGPGLVLLVGFTEEDGEDVLEWMADKILGLRIFSDEEEKMNLSLEDTRRRSTGRQPVHPLRRYPKRASAQLHQGGSSPCGDSPVRAVSPAPFGAGSWKGGER